MIKKEMATKYDFKEVEKGKYDYWLQNGFFESGDISRKPYTIVIPPPNVTGKLHLGHAWDTTLQDIIIRRKRMQGFDALYLPGMDHAGIATQAKIDAKLKAQGISRYDIGREAFLKVAWDWKEEYASLIRAQWATLGLSLDYEKERFTLDKGLNQAVNEVFITLYNEGLIYRGERIINWDIQSKTALSNIEVEYKDIEGAYYHFIYPFVEGKGGLEIVTTRPETMFGDVALMVHPEDKRYQMFIGRKVYIPGTTRAIEVISDEYVDRAFGTGVVKVTPGHDPNDFEVGLRHHLPNLLCMNEDGTMNEYAGKYQGLDRFECRRRVTEDLKKIGLCPKIETMIHSVGHSERTGVIVEPRLSKQWFVKMEPLAKAVIDMQNSEGAINFVPERFNKTFTGWLENIQDWCISRQLWWGHRIPAWYKGDETYVGTDNPGAGWVQDEDVLDTWFSSALWPFSTLGWPDAKAHDLKRYFPTDTLVTGYDIIFFWVARMAFQAKHFLNSRPFQNVLIHGLIRDELGRKMSKSLGNGIDPMDLVKTYGCDALRYFLTTNSTPGQDLRYSEEKLASSWNYINKIWNISRFIKMNLEENNYQNEAINGTALTDIDQWILQKMNRLIEAADDLYERFEFGEAAKNIYNFVWDDFASWYVELTKVVFSADDQALKINVCAILKQLLNTVLKLLHPFMPFVTEEIYQMFNEGSITIAAWPKVLRLTAGDDHLNDDIEVLLNAITAVRNIRAEKNVPMSRKISLVIEAKEQSVRDFLGDHDQYLARFLNFDSLTITDDANKNDAVTAVIDRAVIVIPLSKLVDAEKERERLNSERERLEKEVERSQKMLSNPSFCAKAPADKIAMEKEKLTKYQDQLAEVMNLLGNLGKEGN